MEVTLGLPAGSCRATLAALLSTSMKKSSGLHNKEEAVEEGLGEVRRVDELQRELCERRNVRREDVSGVRQTSTDH